jgi:hypothetical protein
VTRSRRRRVLDPWLAGVAGQAIEQGNEGYLEDALASIQPWGFRPDAIGVPVLIMHGAKDKMVPSAPGERRRPAPLPDAESADLRHAHRRSTDRVGANIRRSARAMRPRHPRRGHPPLWRYLSQQDGRAHRAVGIARALLAAREPRRAACPRPHRIPTDKTAFCFFSSVDTCQRRRHDGRNERSAN